jgi:phage baseplate assembly protein W
MATETEQLEKFFYDYVDYSNLNQFDERGNAVLNERIRRTTSTDLDFRFGLSPTGNDLALKRASNSIKQSLTSLILTDYYEKVFRPDIGSNIKKLLFEPADFITERILEDALINVISNFEPRVNLTSIRVSSNFSENGYDVVMDFYIKNTGQQEQINLFLEASRS